MNSIPNRPSKMPKRCFLEWVSLIQSLSLSLFLSFSLIYDYPHKKAARVRNHSLNWTTAVMISRPFSSACLFDSSLKLSQVYTYLLSLSSMYTFCHLIRVFLSVLNEITIWKVDINRNVKALSSSAIVNNDVRKGMIGTLLSAFTRPKRKSLIKELHQELIPSNNDLDISNLDNDSSIPDSNEEESTISEFPSITCGFFMSQCPRRSFFFSFPLSFSFFFISLPLFALACYQL